MFHIRHREGTLADGLETSIHATGADLSIVFVENEDSLTLRNCKRNASPVDRTEEVCLSK